MKRKLKRNCVLLCALLLSTLVIAENETRTVEFSLAAGAVDRENAPVRVLLNVPETFKSAMVTGEDGKVLVADVVAPSLLSGAAAGQRELVFILPALKANQNATFKAVLSTAAPASGFKWVETPGDNIELSFQDRKVLRYWCKTYDGTNETYKVFHQLYDPKGERLVNKGPGGKFTHHRGIFYGFNKVNFGTSNVDIWHCSKGTHQAHAKVVQSEGGAVLGRHCVLINWNAGDKSTFAEELREISVFSTPGGTLLEFQSRVNSKVGAIKVAGDPQHAGFHFRAHLDVEQKTEKETYFIRADGTGKPGETRNWSAKTPDKTTNLPWNAMSFVIEGQRYTCGYLDHPANPKEGRYSERTYGRFGSYFETEFNETKPLEVKYRLWLQQGAATVETLAAKDADFDIPITATVK